jgi:hypothetical protein
LRESKTGRVKKMLREFQLRSTESGIPSTPSLGETGEKYGFKPCEAQLE